MLPSSFCLHSSRTGYNHSVTTRSTVPLSLLVLALIIALPIHAAALTSPVLNSGWHLISLPGVTDGATPPSIFGSINIESNLFRYEPSRLSYVAYSQFDPPTEFGGLAPDAGYWLYLSTPSTITYTPTLTSSLRRVALPLRGWHIIGAPFYDTLPVIPLTHCLLRRTTDNVSKLMADASTSGWVSLPAFAWDYANLRYLTVGLDGPPLDDDNSWRPWAGYWLNTQAANLELVIQAPLPAGLFTAWLERASPYETGTELWVDAGDVMTVLSVAPLWGSPVQVVFSGVGQPIIPGNVKTLFHALWPNDVTYGAGFQVSTKASGDYTVVVQATLPTGVVTSNTMILHVTPGPG